MGFSMANMGFAASMLDRSSIPATEMSSEHNVYLIGTFIALCLMTLPLAAYRITVRKLMRRHHEAK
jgi:hypothetical protein